MGAVERRGGPVGVGRFLEEAKMSSYRPKFRGLPIWMFMADLVGGYTFFSVSESSFPKISSSSYSPF